MGDGLDSENASGEERWLNEVIEAVGPAQGSEIWIGDDTAVLEIPTSERLLFCGDLVVEDVHFDLSICDAYDVGWKAMAVNLSDIAAMGGKALRAIVSISGAGLIDLSACYAGLLNIARGHGCEVVGGDLSAGTKLVISIAMLGETRRPAPICRTGAQPGESVYLTGPLGASAAGLRLLRSDRLATGPLIDAYRRPTPLLEAGAAAADGGASAMIDISDGLGLDLHRLAAASAVGLSIERVPVAVGASLEEALGGGEDYELVFTASDQDRVDEAFSDRGVDLPLRIGKVVDMAAGLTFDGAPLLATGFTHH